MPRRFAKCKVKLLILLPSVHQFPSFSLLFQIHLKFKHHIVHIGVCTPRSDIARDYLSSVASASHQVEQDLSYGESIAATSTVATTCNCLHTGASTASAWLNDAYVLDLKTFVWSKVNAAARTPREHSPPCSFETYRSRIKC